MSAKVAVIIPWRDRGDPWRKANFEVVLDRLCDLDLGEVIVADDGRTEGPFNRSAAYNLGRSHAPDAACYIWHEADMLVPRQQLVDGVNLALNSHRLVIPFLTYSYISEEDTPQARTGDLSTVTPQQVMAEGRSVGPVGITSARAMAAVGKWDERFSGWGFDDRAMARAFDVCCGPLKFIPGSGWHLYHTPGWQQGTGFAGGAPVVSAVERRATMANKRRYTRYLAATTPEQIRSLTR